MHKCNRCGIEKDDSEFVNDYVKHRSYACLKCRNEDNKKYYSENKDKWNSERARVKQECVDYLGEKCKLCGYSRCNGVLDFHHLDENKKSFTISDKTRGRGGALVKFEELKDELDKCIILCSNCHKELHFGFSKLEREEKTR
jgi:hypothetical protein